MTILGKIIYRWIVLLLLLIILAHIMVLNAHLGVFRLPSTTAIIVGVGVGLVAAIAASIE